MVNQFNWEMLGGMLALLTVFSGIVMVAMKAIISAIIKAQNQYFEQRLAQIEKQISESTKHWQEVERDLLKLRAELPEKYVRREDWIRFAGQIDAKLDTLRAELALTREKMK